MLSSGAATHSTVHSTMPQDGFCGLASTNLALKAVKTQNDLGGLIARGDPESALPASLPISQSFLVCLFLHSGKS